jgi:LacI family transcriptional regulator
MAVGARPARPTIRDVATAAGVSLGTASRALNGHKNVSPGNVDKVRMAVSQLGFQLNSHARSLRSERSGTIGVLVSDIRNPFFAEIARAAEVVALDNEYVTLLANADESVQQQDIYLRGMVSHRIDGLLVAPQGDGTGSLTEIVASGLPVVFVDRTIDGLDVPSVTSDSRPGLREALAHLRSLGHHRIGFIAGPQATSTGRERLAVFLSEARDAGIPQPPELVAQGDFQARSGEVGAQGLMSLANPPTALIAADSLMGVGALVALKARGLRVGRDVSVIAFDDLPYASLFDPGLTVIDQDAEAMGRLAGEGLMAVIRGERPTQVVLPTRLVIRGSCQAPAPGRESRLSATERSQVAPESHAERQDHR